jgi:NADH-quinone oxidoreductase subunit H
MVLEALIKIVGVVGVALLAVAYMILLERKIASWIQDRIGPNRAGPRGLLQPIADGIKLLFKEDFTPAGVNRALFILAPCLMMFLALVGFAVIPFGPAVRVGERLVHLQIARPGIGLLFVLASSALSVYGVLLGGWASNSKYSFLGGLRAAGQMLSYELPLTLAVLNIVLLAGSLRLEEVVARQIEGGWYILRQPLVFVIFLTCIFAEAKRLPFDLAECEQELVGGYHTEYSSMKFGMYFLGEYVHILVSSGLGVTLFFGGWHVPGLDPAATGVGPAVAGVLAFMVKVGLFVFVFMWVRWTLPRFRFDQLMRGAWQVGLPLAGALLVLNALIVYLVPAATPAYRWWQLAANGAVLAGWLLLAALFSRPVGQDNLPVPPEELEELA